MTFSLRDSDMLQKLIDVTSANDFSTTEHHELIWSCYKIHIYDITASVRTFHLLVESCGADVLSRLFENWEVMKKFPLTIHRNTTTVSFLSDGAISFYSEDNGCKLFHAGNPQEVEEFVKLLQRG